MRRTALKRLGRRFADNHALYTAYRRDLWLRCQGRCERPGCGAMAEDAHHTRKPRQTAHAYLVALCRSCHQLVDAPEAKGRLRIACVENYGMLQYTFRLREWARAVILRRLSPGEEAA